MGLKKMKLILLIFALFRTGADSSHSHRPMDLMADLTNDLGVCILQIQSALQHGNTAFSPYGIASMSILLFEGATGNTALEIMKVLNLPWNTLLVRIGFRDINRHLRTYFKSDGFLRGLIMSRDDVCFHPSYQKLLRLYGFEEPDKALTYPCNGFTPYVTSTTTVSSTSIEAMTITSPDSNNETTTTVPTTTVEPTTTTAPQTGDGENVVTEMTQTSQTVVIVNSTTFKPIEAETINAAFTLSKTDLPSSFDGAGITTDYGTKMTTRAINTLDSHQALLSGQTTIFSNNDGSTPTKVDGVTSMSTKPTVVEAAASTITENKFSSITPPKIKESKTERTTPPSTTSAMNVSPFATRPSRNSSSTSAVKNDALAIGDRKKTNVTNNLGPMEIAKNVTKNDTGGHTDFGLNNLDIKNFTTKFETDFTFPPTDTSSAFDNFFNQTNEPQLTPNGNLSLIGKGNISSDLIFPTLPPFSNFSIFSAATPAKDKELDLKNSTTFYSTLVNFIENTTEKIKNLLNSKDVNSTASTSPETATKNIVSNVSTDTPKNDQALRKPNHNTTESNLRQDKMMSNNSSTSTLLLGEKNDINANKGASETTDRRNLPKKSISENNQKPKSAAISISPSTFKITPNYYNILSLKQSKSISSTYDFKGIKSKKHRAKRETSLKDSGHFVTNSNDEKKNQELPELMEQQPPEVNSLSNNQWKIKRNPIMNFWHFDDNETRIETKFHRYSSDDKGRNDFSRTLHAGNIYDSDYRKMRSQNHYFFPPGTDWFTSYGHNIRVPVFSYSAILPFAFIEDLKSKVLEIPLDDQNYRLLILLPAPDYGMDYLINSLINYPLSKIKANLRDTPVYASIPKFSVISHVNLRQALYYLGIRDVFHRYRADLSIMSPDARLFVRSIEQVVTIHVDKFPNTAYPVPEPLTERYFLATHPFVYFVIDKESSVSLVAGTMSDPSRQTVRFV